MVLQGIKDLKGIPVLWVLLELLAVLDYQEH